MYFKVSEGKLTARETFLTTTKGWLCFCSFDFYDSRDILHKNDLCKQNRGDRTSEICSNEKYDPMKCITTQIVDFIVNYCRALHDAENRSKPIRYVDECGWLVHFSS
jgi:hypothetical protein